MAHGGQGRMGSRTRPMGWARIGCLIVRVLIFHGYLLSGTGSNVYTARLAEALVRLGHEVHLFSQDRHAERQPFVDALGDWDEGKLRLSVIREPARCTVYRPDIGRLLPVYVHDRYEALQAKTFAQCTEAEVAEYVQANVAAVREIAERVRPDVALANHLVMGPVILARALEDSVPYAVKVHGSALEYTVKPEPERFLNFAREGLERARTVLVGSRHTAESLFEALGDPELPKRTRLGPPGVDVDRFAPREPRQAEEALRGLVMRLRHGAHMPADGEPNAFARDDAAAAMALERLLGSCSAQAGERGEIVAFVGKLIAGKGIDLLIACWPLVVARRPQARLVVVGFGSWRESIERLCDALAAGDLERAQRDALPYVAAFLRSLSGEERELYVRCARSVAERVVLTGRLDHEELAELLPSCEALVVPSTFPEAFGMVAAEAAACGVLPISARHSGLAEVSEAIAREVPPQVAGWLSFPVDQNAVRAIAERVIAWLEADSALRERTRAGLVSVARSRWSWEGVARGVIAAGCGDP